MNMLIDTKNYHTKYELLSYFDDIHLYATCVKFYLTLYMNTKLYFIMQVQTSLYVYTFWVLRDEVLNLFCFIDYFVCNLS